MPVNPKTTSTIWLVELLEAALTGTSAESPDSYLMVNNHHVSITVREAREFLRHLKDQPESELVILDNELTTTTAAQLLNVTRQHLVHLCDTGNLPYRMEGTHRRLAQKDVLEYRDRRDSERRKRLREHIRTAAESGEYDNPEEWSK